jgi:hypothetical protein
MHASRRESGERTSEWTDGLFPHSLQLTLDQTEMTECFELSSAGYDGVAVRRYDSGVVVKTVMVEGGWMRYLMTLRRAEGLTIATRPYPIPYHETT